MQITRALGTMAGMRTLGAIALLACANAFAHPGHGAPWFHVHEWDFGRWSLWLAIAAIAAFAAWKKK